LTLLPREGRRLDLVDLGAGDGRVYKLLKNKKYEFSSFTACDISEKFLQKHPGKIKKIICDLEEKLPLENGSIDLAFSFFVLEHIANLNTLFEEMERILRP
jgi:ubiquinone/menaquinone biosynthesis C-methylase UbiE